MFYDLFYILMFYDLISPVEHKIYILGRVSETNHVS